MMKYGRCPSHPIFSLPQTLSLRKPPCVEGVRTYNPSPASTLLSPTPCQVSKVGPCADRSQRPAQHVPSASRPVPAPPRHPKSPPAPQHHLQHCPPSNFPSQYKFPPSRNLSHCIISIPPPPSLPLRSLAIIICASSSLISPFPIANLSKRFLLAPSTFPSYASDDDYELCYTRIRQRFRVFRSSFASPPAYGSELIFSGH